MLLDLFIFRRSALEQDMSFLDFVWSGQDPCVNVVLLEDLAAVIGVTVAGGCMSLAHYTGTILLYIIYSQFHKTLPKSSLQMHWISVRFYGMGDSIYNINMATNKKNYFSFLIIFGRKLPMPSKRISFYFPVEPFPIRVCFFLLVTILNATTNIIH